MQWKWKIRDVSYSIDLLSLLFSTVGTDKLIGFDRQVLVTTQPALHVCFLYRSTSTRSALLPSVCQYLTLYSFYPY